MKAYISLLIICLSFLSCRKYLDVKPDKALVIPVSLQDCNAILSNYPVMNAQDPIDGEANADNYYLNDASYNSLFAQEDKNIYTWAPLGQHQLANWSSTYKIVYYSNVVLETLEKIKPSTNEQINWNTLKGAALFFRAKAFFQLAQIYAKPYNSDTKNDLGIPLRLSPDINIKTERSTLAGTYDRIIQDLKESSLLLPKKSVNKSQPNKCAAYSMLARVYLSMEDYTVAITAAEKSLNLYSKLINYNDLDLNAFIPFNIFNDEVIFHSNTSGNSPLIYTFNAKVDKDLYDSYDENDLRKTAFFSPNGDNTYSFKGDYGGDNNNQFTGLAVDEMYLTRAECYARSGNKDAALTDLNTLMISRWRRDAFTPFTAQDAESALKLILKERRKELVFRHQRWTDLRRLNKDQRFAKIIKRTLNGQIYELPPNDLRYTILIPQVIINETEIQQNER